MDEYKIKELLLENPEMKQTIKQINIFNRILTEVKKHEEHPVVVLLEKIYHLLLNKQNCRDEV